MDLKATGLEMIFSAGNDTFGIIQGTPGARRRARPEELFTLGQVDDTYILQLGQTNAAFLSGQWIINPAYYQVSTPFIEWRIHYDYSTPVTERQFVFPYSMVIGPNTPTNNDAVFRVKLTHYHNKGLTTGLGSIPLSSDTPLTGTFDAPSTITVPDSGSGSTGLGPCYTDVSVSWFSGDIFDNTGSQLNNQIATATFTNPRIEVTEFLEASIA